MLKNNKIQKVILMVSMTILAFLCYKSAKMVSANLNYYQTYQLKEFWLKNQKLTNTVQYQSALQAIDYANDTHKNHPEYLITQGLVLEWGGISDLFSIEEQKEQLRLAKTYYLQAVLLRPTWPVTWATLAILKWRLNEIDQSLVDYLKLAEKFGKHTTEVHQAWVDVGFYLYKSKSPYTVQIIQGLREHLRLMLQDERSTIRHSAVAIIKRHQAQKQACNWLSTYKFDTSWHKTTLCDVNSQ